VRWAPQCTSDYRLSSRGRKRPAPIAIAASNVRGARGLIGLPDPPPVCGKPVGETAADLAKLVCASRPALAVLYRYMPPPPVLVFTVGTGTGVLTGAGACVGAVVGTGVAVAFLVGFGVLVGAAAGVVAVGAAVAVLVATAATVAVAAGVLVAVGPGGAGGGPIGVGINVGGGGGVLAAPKLWDGECFAMPTANIPTVTGNANPRDKRLFIQDSLRLALRSGRLVAA
jgi:hypothetical protein